MGKIDGTCGAFLSVVTPGDCRREDRLHLNRWHCEHKERERKLMFSVDYWKTVWFITSLATYQDNNLVNKVTYQAEEGTACFYPGLYSVCTKENTARLSYPWFTQSRGLEREQSVRSTDWWTWTFSAIVFVSSSLSHFSDRNVSWKVKAGDCL